MEKQHSLNIILPTYNPHGGWESEFIHSLQQLKEHMTGIDYTVTIVNDGSKYDISTFIETRVKTTFNNVMYLHYEQNMGKGHAIRYGLQQSKANYHIYTDFDFPFGYAAIANTYLALQSNKASLVIGTRDITYFKALPFKRKLLSITLKVVNSLVTRFRVKDTQAGLKGLDEKARLVFLTTKTNSFIFELEFILKCLKEKISYTFIHVQPNPEIIFSNFGSKTIKREFKNFWHIIFG